MGLNRPVIVRYGEWLGNTLSGDLGYSTLYKTEVNAVIWDRLGNTSLLAGIAFAVMVPLSIIFGISAGMREGSVLDRTISVASIVTTSVPEFASGVFLASIFVIWLGWLPGTSPLETGSGWSIWQQLVLPVAVMVLYDLGYVVRMVRASMVEVMTRPYIRTAVLKGLSFRAVIMKHALRNAMIAPFTVILLQINYLVTGVVVVEAVFAYPGFGRMLLEAALAQDVAIVEAGALFAVLISVSTQIAGDLGYMMLNPRIRFS
jgi:peptide/nickel transport system permease protein